MGTEDKPFRLKDMSSKVGSSPAKGRSNFRAGMLAIAIAENSFTLIRFKNIPLVDIYLGDIRGDRPDPVRPDDVPSSVVSCAQRARQEQGRGRLPPPPQLDAGGHPLSGCLHWGAHVCLCKSQYPT